nr:alanine racemase [Rikenella sp.]
EMRSRGITGAAIHLKLDTGMHRLGFVPEEIGTLCELLGQESAVRVRSIFSHLAASEDPAEDDFTRGQIALFREMSARIVDALGDESILRHVCNSAGIARFPEAHLDMVRLGVGLYGIEDPELQPVATLRTQIVQIKQLRPGDTVGYNRRGVVERPMRTATIPIGYADGMDRGLGRGAGRVEIRGMLCPTVGNICMDTCMIDVTELPEAAVGDEVVVFGERPTVREVAEVLGTISYEVLTSVSARIKRIYVRE